MEIKFLRKVCRGEMGRFWNGPAQKFRRGVKSCKPSSSKGWQVVVLYSISSHDILNLAVATDYSVNGPRILCSYLVLNMLARHTCEVCRLACLCCPNPIQPFKLWSNNPQPCWHIMLAYRPEMDPDFLRHRL